ncbi:MAG: hypothetical protein HKO98_10055 [Gemmatimonadetes bacterium]|nr:hypothetical protein [Gemmatimonadota bacterium]
MTTDIDSLKAAYRDQDWHAVVRLASADPRGEEALLVGHARWYLGEVGEALALLEEGLSGSDRSPAQLSAFRYAAGMARLLKGDPAGARRHLLEALEAPTDDAFRFPALRGLAQVEMELGLLDAAAHHLRHLPDFGPGHHLQHALRAKVAWRAGRVDEARAHLWHALGYAISVTPTVVEGSDPYPLVDDAGLLVAGAEILAAMGHGEECQRALDTATALLGASGVTGLPVHTHLELHRALAYRLTGEHEDAAELLDAVEEDATAAGARDLLATVARERARLLWDRGDRDEAREALAAAARQFDAIGYVWEADATRHEATAGPPAPVPTEPLEDWFEEDVGTDEPPPVGVVVSLILPEDEYDLPDLIGALTEELADRLAETTRGLVDGWGTDGRDLEIFVYGDDPAALWEAMKEPIDDLGLDGHVRMEWGDRFQILLLHPPANLAGLRRLRPLLPLLARERANDPPWDLAAVAAAASAQRPDEDGPEPIELEWVRGARLEWSRIWLWRWRHPAEDRYVTLTTAPGVPPFALMEAAEGLTPEQHLVSLRYGYRTKWPDDLW